MLRSDSRLSAMGRELVTMCSDFGSQFAGHGGHRRAAVQDHRLAVFDQARGEPRDAALFVAQAHALHRVIEGAIRRRLHAEPRRRRRASAPSPLPEYRDRGARWTPKRPARGKEFPESRKSLDSNIWRILKLPFSSFHRVGPPCACLLSHPQSLTLLTSLESLPSPHR